MRTKSRLKRCCECDVELHDVYTTVRFNEFVVFLCLKCAARQAENLTVNTAKSKGAVVTQPRKKAKAKKKKVKPPTPTHLTKVCEGCDKKFKVPKKEDWKKLCFPCWKKWRDLNESLDLEAQIALDKNRVHA